MKEYFLQLPIPDTNLPCENRIDIVKEGIKIIKDFDRRVRSSGESVDGLKTIPAAVAFATLGLSRMMNSREVRLGLSRKMLKTTDRLIETYGPKARITVDE